MTEIDWSKQQAVDSTFAYLVFPPKSVRVTFGSRKSHTENSHVRVFKATLSPPTHPQIA